MKADKDYVYMGAIYLKGAEMPEGWEKPPAPKVDPGVTMFGPHGQLFDLPGVPLPAGVSLPEQSPEDMAFEDLVRKLQARGLRIEAMPTRDDLAAQLTDAHDSAAAADAEVVAEEPEGE